MSACAFLLGGDSYITRAVVVKVDATSFTMASPIQNDDEPQILSDTEEEGPKWVRKKGPIALRSKVWEHFKEKKGDKTTVKCDHCPKTFKFTSSTTGLKYHLQNVHNLMKEGANTANEKTAEKTKQLSIQESMSGAGAYLMPLDEVRADMKNYPRCILVLRCRCECHQNVTLRYTSDSVQIF